MGLSTSPARKALILITALAAALRLYGLQDKLFWVDEYCEYQAAVQVRLYDCLEVSRHHVAAPPLDYVVAWLVAQWNTSEWALRLPGAIWGIFCVPAAYALFSRLSGQRVGLGVAALVAINPTLILYSQEFRFYSPLVFFTLAATWTLLRAWETPTRERWRWYFGALLIGCGFHLFTFFVTLLGLLLALRDRKLPREFLAVTMAVGSVCLFVMVRWSQARNGGGSFHLELDFMLQALGYLPSWWEAVAVLARQTLAVLAAFGVWTLVRRDRTSPAPVVALWYVSVCLLIPLILYCKSYFIHSRQFVALIPFSLYLVVVGLEGLLGARVWLLGASLTALMLAHGPALRYYYQTEKSDAGTMMRGLTELRPRSGEVIYVDPPWEIDLFRHYAPRFGINPDQLVAGVKFAEKNQGRTFLINWDGGGTKSQVLHQQGFEPQPSPPVLMLKTTLWVRPPQ